MVVVVNRALDAHHMLDDNARAPSSKRQENEACEAHQEPHRERRRHQTAHRDGLFGSRC